jgi:hypothetical protein
LDIAGRARQASEGRAVIVWIWAASGPGDFCGVTDDPERARDAAAGCISSGEASAARVESARARLGTGWLTEGYVRSGHGWTATAAGGGTVVWKPFAPLAAAS